MLRTVLDRFAVKDKRKGSGLRFRAFLFSSHLSAYRGGVAASAGGALLCSQKKAIRGDSSLKIRRLAVVLALLAWLLGAASAPAQLIPASLNGKWRIVKILPTHNPQCWDEERARTLIGTLMVYQAHAMVWQGGAVPIADALSRTLSRRKFHDEYRVELAELGIAADAVEEIDLQHEDADITGATTEVPGDTILITGPGRIVVSSCGVFYAAVRVTGKAVGGR